MKVVERKALEAFRQALSNPRCDWRVHLSAGLGYDLDRLQAEIESALPDGAERFHRIEPLYNRALEALGNARRATRQNDNAVSSAGRALLDATERLYDRIESIVGKKTRREFLTDGLRKTDAWLACHDDRNGKVAAQKARLLRAKRRRERKTDVAV